MQTINCKASICKPSFKVPNCSVIQQDMWLILFIICEYSAKLTGISTCLGNGLFSVSCWHISVLFLGGQWFGTGLKHFKASINISFLSNYPQGKITVWPLHNFKSYSLTSASALIRYLQ